MIQAVSKTVPKHCVVEKSLYVKDKEHFEIARMESKVQNQESFIQKGFLKSNQKWSDKFSLKNKLVQDTCQGMGKNLIKTEYS